MVPYQHRSKVLLPSQPGCRYNGYIFIVFAVIKGIDKWKLFDLDFIFKQGDKAFELVGVNEPLTVDQLPRNAINEVINVSAEIFSNGICFPKKSIYIWNEAIFAFCGFSILMIWTRLFSSFDLQNCQRSDFHDPNEKTVFLKFSVVSSFNNSMK